MRQARGRPDRGLGHPACFPEPAVGALADGNLPPPPRFYPPKDWLALRLVGRKV